MHIPHKTPLPKEQLWDEKALNISDEKSQQIKGK